MAKTAKLSNSPLLTDAQKAEYDARLEKFRAGVEKIHAESWERDGYTHNPGSLAVIVKGQRYDKVFLCEMSWVDPMAKAEDRQIRRGADGKPILTEREQIHSFIDKLTGDVLKPATYRAPAKHARGNLFDATNGLGLCNSFGPAYLR